MSKLTLQLINSPPASTVHGAIFGGGDCSHASELWGDPNRMKRRLNGHTLKACARVGSHDFFPDSARYARAHLVAAGECTAVTPGSSGHRRALRMFMRAQEPINPPTASMP